MKIYMVKSDYHEYEYEYGTDTISESIWGYFDSRKTAKAFITIQKKKGCFDNYQIKAIDIQDMNSLAGKYQMSA